MQIIPNLQEQLSELNHIKFNCETLMKITNNTYYFNYKLL